MMAYYHVHDLSVLPAPPPSATIFKSDRTCIAAASILRVLRGVADATRAPDLYVRPLKDLLEHSGGKDLGESLPAEKVTDHLLGELEKITRPFNDWLEMILHQKYSPGTEQVAQVTMAVSLLREKASKAEEMDAQTLDIVWSMVQNAVIKARDTGLHFTTSRSALGFLAVPLCSLIVDGKIDELWRFHTWLPDGQRGLSEDAFLHAHQPFGQSWILVGSGTDCTFQVDSPKEESVTTHAVYECCYYAGETHGAGYQTHQTKSVIRNTTRHVRVTPGKSELHSRDMTYTVPAGMYHRSIVPGDRIHATFFVFDAKQGYDDTAAVLGPKYHDEYEQMRDPGGISADVLARIVGATRKWEQCHEIPTQGGEEHAMTLVCYAYFRGMGLLQLGRREDAMKYLDPDAPRNALIEAFVQNSAKLHPEFIKRMAELGVDIDNTLIQN